MALELVGKVSLDGSGWESGIRQIESSTTRVKELIASAFGTAAITAAIKSTVEWASHLADAATRLGISTDEVQAFSFAAVKAGSDIDGISTAFDHLAKNLEKARDGDEKLRGTFDRLGVSLRTVLAGSPADAFREISDTMEKSDVTTRVMADTLEAMGRSGTKLIPVMKELNQNMSEFAASGGGVSAYAIKNVKQFGDELTAGLQRAKGGGVHILEDFLTIKDRLMDLIQDMREFKKVSQEAGQMLPGLGGSSLEKIRDAFREWKAGMEERHSATDMKHGMAELGAGGVIGKIKVEFPEPTDPAMWENYLRRNTMFEPNVGEALKKEHRAVPEDSLIRVGNFLGGSGDAISRIGERTNALLEMIHRDQAELIRLTAGRREGVEVPG